MITILSYGVGNIQAFCRAFDILKIPYEITSSKSGMQRAKKLLLPGVGSFDNAISLLNNSGFRDNLEKLVISYQVPILGVCVGMQMFANSSEEGDMSGLGWIDGTVKKFPSKKGTVIPHMGWNNVNWVPNFPLLEGLSNENYFYFLHSYFLESTDKTSKSITSHYDFEFPSIVSKENIIGTQFHPEKSHASGLVLLNNFYKNF